MEKLKKTVRIILKGFFWIAMVMLFLLTVSALYNQTLRSSSSVTQRLTEPQKAYIAEYFNLQDKVIKEFWPDLEETRIPVIVYNEEFAFLVGLETPEAGWIRVPSGLHRGNEWIEMDGDHFQGNTYYYQSLPDPDTTPENFTVKVGSVWVSTLQTREFAEVSFYSGFKKELPPLIRQVFPYKLFWNLVMGEAESYLAALIHEAFHAHQGMLSNKKFSRAESITEQSDHYPWDNDENKVGWESEVDILLKAYESDSDAEIKGYISEYIYQREERRKAADLSDEQIEYEKNREWLEGLAKYTELKIGMVADELPSYEPVEEIAHLSDFRNYSNRESYLRNQLQETERAINRRGDNRFYYTGMLQAIMLDRVYPDWKRKIFNDGIFPEDLLREVVLES
ncbi:hypothetical protein [Rhodohalobacter mucosus]|uniref:Uncharacterized protein n=1 Tax=Rhodohalobacter mucosus TaxID=2079485 RepID=A0A316TSB5_9BACT|nr:hypothetical protein [Rhodohalobacter mucosus]PWN06531.1 hypothetical protein DDZ15_08400 [Rhodohalobacter mucosus]